MASACTVLDGTAGSLTVHTDQITSPGGRRGSPGTPGLPAARAPQPVSGPGTPGLRFDF
jgi:hypothetical protein